MRKTGLAVAVLKLEEAYEKECRWLQEIESRPQMTASRKTNTSVPTIHKELGSANEMNKLEVDFSPEHLHKRAQVSRCFFFRLGRLSKESRGA